MMPRDPRWAVVALLAVTVAILGGCGGSDQLVFQFVSERATWSNDGARLTYAALGGNGLLYVYSLGGTGGGLVLLTPSDNDADLTDEGGKQPAWSPDGTDICVVSRRGGSQALFLMDPTVGDRARFTRITDDSGTGADAQPSWAFDSSKLVYISNRGVAAGSSVWNLVTINRDGSSRTEVVADGRDNQWPCFDPDASDIAYQSRAGVADTTDIFKRELASATTTQLTGPDTFRDEAPNWSPDGATIVLHSNRDGDFDIWAMNADGSSPRQLTNDARSDGFPTWSRDGLHIVFTRDREIWTMDPDGANQRELTRRF